MKNTLKALVLAVGLLGTFAYATIPTPPVPKDGPMPICLNHPGKPPCPQVQ